MLGSHVLRFADSSTHPDTPGGFVPTVHHILTRSDISIFDNSSQILTQCRFVTNVLHILARSNVWVEEEELDLALAFNITLVVL